jgi:hypothetical protein
MVIKIWALIYALLQAGRLGSCPRIYIFYIHTFGGSNKCLRAGKMGGMAGWRAAGAGCLPPAPSRVGGLPGLDPAHPAADCWRITPALWDLVLHHADQDGGGDDGGVKWRRQGLGNPRQ